MPHLKVFSAERLSYSDKYCDSHFEYRHVVLPKEMVPYLPKKLMSEREWRELGVQMSRGWIHYMIHNPEPHILLFKRPLKGVIADENKENE